MILYLLIYSFILKTKLIKIVVAEEKIKSSQIKQKYIFSFHLQKVEIIIKW